MSKEGTTYTEATLRTIKIRNTEKATVQVTSIDALLSKLPRDFSNCAIFYGRLVLGSDNQQILHLRMDMGTLLSAS